MAIKDKTDKKDAAAKEKNGSGGKDTKIPNSSSLYDIFKKMLEEDKEKWTSFMKDMTSFTSAYVKDIEKLIAKMKDTATLMNVSLTTIEEQYGDIVANLDYINKIVGVMSSFSQSQLVKGNAVRDVKKLSDNLVVCASYISDSLLEVRSILAESMSNSIGNISNMLVSNPIEFISRMKAGEPIGQDVNGPLEEYYNIIKLVADIANYSSKVSIKDIKKSSKAVLMAMKSIIRIRRFLNLRSIFLRPLSVPATKFLESLPHIWELVHTAQAAELEFLANSEKVKPRVLKRAVKDFFKTYVYMIVGAAELGAGILTGNFDSKFLGITLKKTRVKHKDMIFGLVAAIGLSKYLEVLAKFSKPVFDELAEIGENKRDVKKGVKVMFSSYAKIIHSVSTLKIPKEFYLNALRLIAVSAELSLLFIVAEEMINGLIKLGTNLRSVRRGLRAFSLIFIGGGLFKRRSNSLVGMVASVRITPAVMLNALKLIAFTALMSIEFMLMNGLVTAITRLGRRKRLIKKGLRAFHWAVLKMIDIVTDRRIRRLKLLTVVRSLALITIMTTGFMLAMIPMQAIGMMAPFLALAIISVASATVVLPMMIFNLKLVWVFRKTIVRGARYMMLLGRAYLNFARALRKMSRFNIVSAVAAIIVMTGAIILAVISFIFVGKAGRKAALGIAVTVSISLSLILMAATLALVGLAVRNIDFLGILAFIGVVALIVAAYAVLGLLMVEIAVLIIPTLIATIGICMSLRKMARTVKKLEKLDIDEKKVKDNIRALIRCVTEPLAELDGKSMSSLLAAKIKIRRLRKITNSIYKIAKLVRNMANLEFTDYNGNKTKMKESDFITAVTNGKRVIQSILGIFITPDVKDTEIMTQLDRVGISLVHKMRKLKRITRIIGRMCTIVANMAKLKMPDMAAGLDKNGVPLGWKVMTEADFENVIKNGEAVISSILSIFVNPDGSDTEAMIQLEKVDFTLVHKMRQLKRITRAIGKTASLVADMAALKMPDPAGEFDKDGKATKWILMTGNSFEKTIENGQKVISSILNIFFKDGKETEVMTNLDKVSLSMKIKMRRLSKITDSIASAAAVITGIASLKYPTEFIEKGEPTAYKLMNTTDFENAALNGAAVVKIIASLFGDTDTIISTATGSVTISPIPSNTLEKIDMSTRRKIGLIAGITKSLGKMASVIASVSSLKIPEAFDAEGNPTSYRKLKDSDFKDFATNSATVIKTVCGAITDAISDGDIENIKRRTLKRFKEIMDCGIGSFSSIVDIISKMATGQFSVIETDEAGHPLLDKNGVQKTVLKTFNDIDIPGATKKMGEVIRMYLTSVGTIFENKDTKNLAKAISKNMPENMGIEGISSFIDSIVNLSLGKFPVIETDEAGHTIMVDGSPSVIYKSLGTADIKNAVSKISTLYSAYINGMSSLFLDSKGNTTQLAENAASLSSVFYGSDGLLDSIDRMSASAEKLMSVANLEDLDGKVKSLVTAYKTLVTEFDKATVGQVVLMTDPLGEFISMTNRLFAVSLTDQTGKNINQSFDSMGKFVERLNKVDDGKLAKMASISKNMADFARKINGNFDKLADIMNEKMVTALEKVEETLKEVNKTMTEVPNKIAASRASVSLGGGGVQQQAAAGTDNKSADKKDDKKDNKKDKAGKNVTGKSINNCIVQADDGTYAIAIVQKSE